VLKLLSRQLHLIEQVILYYSLWQKCTVVASAKSVNIYTGC